MDPKMLQDLKQAMKQSARAEALEEIEQRYKQNKDNDSIMRAFEVAFEHAIRNVVQQKLAEKMKDIEAYFNAVDLQKVISDILASEFTRQFVAGRLIGKPAMDSSGGVASGAKSLSAQIFSGTTKHP